MNKYSLMITAACLAFSSVAFGISAEEILKKADEIRNPSESFQMTVEVKNSDSQDVSIFEVLTGGKDKTLIKTLEPARDRGRNMLMQGDDMWAYIPNLKRAVRISLNQKLTGQAANGDIARMRWHGDYTAKVEKETDKDWILFLTATRKGLTYEKIRAWVNKATNRPMQAEYLTLAGKPLKRAQFGNYKQMAGGLRPLTIRIADFNKDNNYSQINISKMEVKSFPESTFHQNSLSE